MTTGKWIALLLVTAVCGTVWYFARGGSTNMLIEPARADAAGPAGIENVKPSGPASALCVPGRPTVVLVGATWCKPSQSMTGHLRSFMSVRPDIAVRLIDLDEMGGRAQASQTLGLNIHGTPHTVIYDADGNVVASDGPGSRAGSNGLVDWINAEVRKQWEERRKK